MEPILNARFVKGDGRVKNGAWVKEVALNGSREFEKVVWIC